MTFELFQPSIRKSAIVSECATYRYELRRVWDDALPMLAVCMLNPSTADASVDDPTVLKLIHFGKLWGYGGLLIVNLYAFRSPSPKEMFAAGAAAVGPQNEKFTAAAVFYARDNGGKLLAAWGNDGNERAMFFARWTRCQGVELVCLGTTQSGAPKHPMARGLHRIPRDQRPIPWGAA
ncbi:DUF1643 domain-containing protein [Sinorhizobium meliloti]|uniref:DUF1643 domain-containing protein n=1 Tax=Rhizobium meliloti TaxID=382 RepID=UPI000FDB69FD|nr:DUF1643 domain-containing protein [Sinorhizobium meliloti]RVM91495.1 DUF1643 domain-containing protein [Sinorhizobium meliloti]